ncbi:MAG: glutamate--cysteine ligase, partial [Nocardioidaceae bacterium]
PVPAAELLLRRLIPMADEGLAEWGVGAADRDRLLGIIEQRCTTGQNGAAWQAAVFHRAYDERGLDRLNAMRDVVRRYRTHMHSNEPVHTWPVD